jgi:hypothetical protein
LFQAGHRTINFQPEPAKLQLSNTPAQQWPKMHTNLEKGSIRTEERKLLSAIPLSIDGLCHPTKSNCTFQKGNAAISL